MGAHVLTDEQITIAAKASGAASYVFGSGTFFGGVLGVLNDYALAIGAICAVLTFIANTAFKWLERRDRLNRWRRKQ